MDVRTLYTKIRNGSEHQVQEMQVIMESFLKQRSRSFSELNHKEQAERLISEANLEERQHLYSCTALGVDGSATSALSISGQTLTSVRSDFSISASS